MMKRIFVICLLMTSAAGYASDAYVDAEEEFGQGVFRQRGHECFFLTPKHVVGDADEIRLFTEGKAEYPGKLERVYDIDLAIVRSDDVLPCENRKWESGNRLRYLLDNFDDGVIKTRRPDGTLAQTRVFITEKGDPTRLSIKPRSVKDALQKGNSGSILYIDGEMSGMLLSVKDGVGTILRQDAMHNTVKTFFDAVKTPLSEIIGDSDLFEYNTTVATFKGMVKQGETQDYKIGLDENSPLIFRVEKAKDGLEFNMELFDSRRKSVANWTRLGGAKQDLVFTPASNGGYHVRITGARNSGEYYVDAKLVRTDKELRGRGNIVNHGERVIGRIAQGAIAEYTYKAEENEPVLVVLDAIENGARYDLEIVDRRHNLIKKLTDVGSASTDVVFTPPKRDRYIFRLTGTRSYSVFSFDAKKLGKSEWFSDKQNLQMEEPIDGMIVEGASSEFRFKAKENHPLVFAVESDNPAITYKVEVEGKFRKTVQEWLGKNKYGEFVFTPPKSANYTLRITGTKSYGESSIELREVGVSADKATNNIEIDQMVDTQIAEGEQKEFVFRADKNSPFLIGLQDVDDGLRFGMEVVDPRGQVAKSLTKLGQQPQEIAFTPQYEGFHKIRVIGEASFGEFSFSVQQITSNHDLMNGGNRVKVNRSPVESVIAEGAIAQYKLDSYTNKDIVIVAGSMSGGGSYGVQLYALNGKLIQEWKNLGSKQNDLKVSLPEPGYYALKVIGERHYGEYSISAVSERFR